MNNPIIKTYVWSRKVRIFHWLSVLSILLLIALGLVIFNSKALGVSTDGKILLKTLHVLVGYVFAFNLLIRLVVGFTGKGFERWSKTLPFMKGFGKEVAEKKPVHKGHSPAGKLMVGALLLAMSVQMVTGLILAGTDIYYPPIGSFVQEFIADNAIQAAMIEPYDKTLVNANAYAEMRSYRKPVITAHLYAFYSLLLLIPLHIIGVVRAERREKSGLTSAMITGYKYLPEESASKD